jgi:hypothetical protein
MCVCRTRKRIVCYFCKTHTFTYVTSIIYLCNTMYVCVCVCTQTDSNMKLDTLGNVKRTPAEIKRDNDRKKKLLQSQKLVRNVCGCEHMSFIWVNESVCESFGVCGCVYAADSKIGNVCGCECVWECVGVWVCVRCMWVCVSVCESVSEYVWVWVCVRMWECVWVWVCVRCM